MEHNPILKKIGFAPTDRVCVVHADDIGMCQATLTAFDELTQVGLVTSGAVMMPCSWAPAAAEYARTHPEVDLGVHLTLTSEWNTYRWGPISTRDPGSGLLDLEGYFYRDSESVQQKAVVDFAQRELQAQVEAALAAGIKITHIDTHMGTVAHPKFIAAYAMLGMMYRVPILAARLDEAGYLSLGVPPEAALAAGQMTRQMEEAGMPLHDGIYYLDLQESGDRMEMAKRAFDSLPTGLSRIYLHPSSDTPEARAISPDAACRIMDYKNFLKEELLDYARGQGIQLIGYRAIQQAMAL